MSEFSDENPFIASSKPPLGVKSIFECPENDFTQSEDFGRESLGIFNVNGPGFEQVSFLGDDFGRESLGTFNVNDPNFEQGSFLDDDFGRESLGIFNVNGPDFEQVSLLGDDFGRESLLIRNLRGLDIGRELAGGNTRFIHDLPEVVVSDTTINSVLNNAFLKRSSSSVGTTVSSIYPSFHSASLEDSFFSRIRSEDTSAGSLNDAFQDTSGFLRKLKIARSSTSTCSSLHRKIFGEHHRVYSLPTSLDQKKKSEESICENISADDEFNDSVFIEARHFASRIADASFVEAEDDMLQSIREPEDFADVSDEEPVKYDRDIVFKTVDKMILPPPNHDSRDSTNLSRNVNVSEQNNTSRSSNRSANSNSQSRDAIVSSVSEFVNNNPNEAVDFLSWLSDFVVSRTSTRSSAVDDSGHSSIESDAVFERPATYEVLDLSKKSSSETSINRREEVCVPLDLSVKSKSASEKSFLSPKTVLPPKFNDQKILSVSTNKNLASNCSNYSDGSKNSDSAKQFKPRKVEAKVAGRRGPMKAVLPVNNMAKGKSTNLKITPTRSETKSICKMKKASTPINEPLIKPMAQSTPDFPKSVCATSPVSRPNKPYDSGSKSLKEKLTKLPTINKSFDGKNKANSFIRRVSAPDVKKIQTASSARSHSVDRKFVSSKIESNFKQTIQRRSLLARPKTESTSVLKENRNKSFGAFSTGKKIGLGSVANADDPVRRTKKLFEDFSHSIVTNMYFLEFVCARFQILRDNVIRDDLIWAVRALSLSRKDRSDQLK